MRRRVVVTGVGVVAPCGVGQRDFWAGLLAEPEPRRERRAEDFDPSRWFSAKEQRRTDRFTLMALVAGQEAWDDARAGELDLDPYRAGVSVGTGIGGVGTLETQVGVLAERGPTRVSPFTIPMVMPNAGAASLSLRHGWRGPCETLTTACAAGTHSVLAGARLVAEGRCDAVLAGGAEASMTPTTIAGFTTMTALSGSGISRPFDKDRDGFCIAEGAAVLVLETLDGALARGAQVYGEVLGGASTADAHHITAPAPGGEGAVACMRLALQDAGVEASDVVHVNAHGTSTPLNDAAEAAAVSALLGDDVPVTSIKGVTGHALGAAGALEAASVLLAYRNGVLPPTAGFREPGEGITIDVVTEPRPFTPGVVLSNSFGFGGHNGALVLGPPPG